MASSANPVLPVSYNYLQVAVSVLIAISGSYVALFLSERLHAARTLRWLVTEINGLLDLIEEQLTKAAGDLPDLAN